MSDARRMSPDGQAAPEAAPRSIERPGLAPLDGDVSYPAILRFAVGLTVLIVVSAALMWFFTTGLRDRVAAQDPPPPVLLEARMRYEPPGPRLQESPEKELRVMKAEDEAALSEYAWADEAAGIARIPVARAMELLVARGGVGTGSAPTRADGAEIAPPEQAANAAGEKVVETTTEGGS